jgi:predicted aconitase
MPVALDDRDRALLAGDSGEGAAFAMRLVLRAAEALSAPHLIPIVGAHVDSCLYHGQASIDFVERLAAGGATVAVPTTLNVGALDLIHPGLWRGDPADAERGRLLMDRYRTLGCRPTYTCAPYQLQWERPRPGEQVAWAESNAIVFCNSVLGARTNRYGDFLDVACAIVGRVPFAGLHRDDARRARLVLRLADDVPRDSLLPSLLGIALGRHAGSSVAVIEGLPADLGEDGLKAIGAAAASSGAVAMFHAVGLTPEAATLEAALDGAEPEAVETITLAELRAIRDELSAQSEDAPLRGVALGTPHASLAELREVERRLGSRRPAVELVVSTARDLAAAEPALIERLETAGVKILFDTCSYVSPVFAPGSGVVMTDSGKWAYYAPATIGAATVIGSTEDCIASAVAGRVVRGSSAWDA